MFSERGFSDVGHGATEVGDAGEVRHPHIRDCWGGGNPVTRVSVLQECVVGKGINFYLKKHNFFPALEVQGI